MTPFDLDEPRCGCVSSADAIRFECEGLDPPLCPIHDVEAIAEREAAQLRATADAEQARFGEVRAALEPSPAECSCPDLVDSLHAALLGVEFEPCAAHPEPSLEQSSTVSPGDDAAIVSILRGALGRDTSVNTFSGDDLPPAA